MSPETRTPIMRRLDDDFEEMFSKPLPPIAAPISPEQAMEAEQAQVRG